MPRDAAPAKDDPEPPPDPALHSAPPADSGPAGLAAVAALALLAAALSFAIVEQAGLVAAALAALGAGS